MSLNGLESEKVKSAYNTAIAEAGGWLLLKYISRDEVELLLSGTGGLSEIRNAISEYPEASPLYGFLRYRRRTVLVKCIPEGTSRLLQARTAVHFQSVIDQFTPHDAIFPITAASELSSQALSKACSLHTATGSISSTTSSNKRRLDEITEDAEETRSSPTKETSAKGVNKEGKKPMDKENLNRSPRAEGESIKKARLEVGSNKSSISNRYLEKPLPMTPLELDLPGSISTSLASDVFAQSSDEQKPSSSASKFSTQDFYSSFNLPKPKVKLGPRPSADVRRRTSSVGPVLRQDEPRPVSSLPAGIRVAPRKESSSRPPTSQSMRSTMTERFTDLLPIPDSAQLSIFNASRPGTSAGTISSAYSIISQASTTRSNAVSTEKQRLMKALQLRKKQMGNSNENRRSSLAHSTRSSRVITPPKSQRTSATTAVELGMESLSEDLEVPTELSTPNPTVNVEPENRPILPIESSPISMVESSEQASTQASSLSEIAEQPEEEKESPMEMSSRSDIEDVKPAGIENPSSEDESESSDEETPRNSQTPPPENPQDFNPIPSVRETENRGDAESAHSPTASSIAEASISTSSIDSSSVDSESSTPVAKSKKPLDRITSKSEASNPVASAPNAPPSSPEIAMPVLETSISADELSIPAKALNPDLLAPPLTAKNNKKRNSHISQAQAETNSDISDSELISDDEFLEGLNTATVHEAKPVEVRRSPITKVFPDEVTTTNTKPETRAVSNPIRRSSTLLSVEHTSPKAAPPSRSPSSNYLNSIRNKSSPISLLKNVNISTGISQRIKKLELLSNQNNTSSSSATPSTFGSSFSPPRGSSQSPSFRSRLTPIGSRKRDTPISKAAPSLSPSPSPSPELKFTKPEPIKNSMQETVSVTAQIIRDPNATSQPPLTVMPEIEDRLDLRQSPLTFDHGKQKTSTTAKNPDINLVEPQVSDDAGNLFTSKPWSSMHSITRPSSVASRHSTTAPSFYSMKSMNFRRDSNSSLEKLDVKTEGKKESKASRLMRRVSSLTVVSRKNLTNTSTPTKREEVHLSFSNIPEEPVPQSVEVGEVNVQFPDNLLWKRRILKLDSQNNLFLLPSRADDNLKLATRRYHISEFYQPVVPDHERQELPNSIVLDLREGSTLQCACEDSLAQRQILKLLQASYNSWLSAT